MNYHHILVFFLNNFLCRGKEVAVIYGSLPPNTKLAQAEKFNDPSNPCKIMVATDAIGMGLNLYVEKRKMQLKLRNSNIEFELIIRLNFRSIRRIIFYSVVKLQLNESNEKEISPLTVSTALQIAGKF